MGEKIYVVGVQFMNFKGNDGKQVDGVKVHYTQQVNRQGLSGDIAGNFFVSRQYWDGLAYQPKCGEESAMCTSTGMARSPASRRRDLLV